MIITCEKCNKTFNIQDKLIPDNGRLLQCGSCGHKWFFKITKQNFEQINQINQNTNSNNEIKEENKKETIYEDKIEENKTSTKKQIKKPLKKPKIIKNTLVLIISLVALIVLIDTFKNPLENYFPNLKLILNNLYETLKDLSLFFKDLIN